MLAQRPPIPKTKRPSPVREPGALPRSSRDLRVGRIASHSPALDALGHAPWKDEQRHDRMSTAPRAATGLLQTWLAAKGQPAAVRDDAPIADDGAKPPRID